jgi:ABC-type antimicrobial peptide transport system permease subunit
VTIGKNLRSLVSVSLPRAAPGVTPAAAADESVGVFISAQSIVTFPVASTVVTVVSQVLQAVFPALKGSNLVPLVLALVVGLLVYAISITKQMTTREKLIGLAIAVINCFFLAAGALGISAVAQGQTTTTP